MTGSEVSFIVPCYNEKDNLSPLVEAIEAQAEALDLDYEIVVTDDRSTDGSWEVLQRLARTHPRLRGLRLEHNCGESAAIFAAMHAARGAILVTLDADLQNDPRDLPAFLAALREADCVCGTRKQSRRAGDGRLKSVVSRISNGVRSRILRDSITDAGCTYRAFRRECIDQVPFFNGVHRFLPILIGLQGYRVTEVPVTNRPRHSGRSHYGVLNRAGAVIDMFAVRWMKKRMIRYCITEHIPPE